MMKKGVFKTGHVDEWMDCGIKCDCRNEFRMLGFTERRYSVSGEIRIDNSTIIPPCILRGCVLINSTVGPNVSLEKDAMLQVVSLKQFDSDNAYTSAMPI
jgi:hypothetical protein